MSRFLFSVILLMAQVVWANPTSAQKAAVKVTGVYSSLTFNKETGDVVGEEVIVGVAREGHYVVFQTSEGAPSLPVVVSAKVDGTRIKFTLPAPMATWGEFEGVISRHELVGKFSNSEQVIKLKRKSSYWQ
jgi:hypothetical protein